MTSKHEGRGVELNEFLGISDAPDRLERVVQRRCEPPAEEEPKELQFARAHRTVIVPPDAGEIESETLRIEGLDDYRQIRLRSEGPFAHHLPGREALREWPERLCAEVNPRVGTESHRPGWIDGTFHPRIDPVGPQSLRRFNGRTVRPLYVFGPDDRRTYRDRSWPWGLMGRVFTSEGKSGSAALIGDRIIATAGHMVPWGQSGWWMRFVPAYYDGISLHGASVESYVSDARGYDVTGRPTGYDWAVCRLYNPLGSWLGYFGYNGFASSWEDDPYWTILGYPGAVASAQRPSYQTGISVFDIDGDSNGGKELETKGDVTPGNSGGPMFGWWSGDPRLVGVVSGEEEDWSPGFWPWDWADVERGNVIAGGSGFTNLMAWGRTNWT